MLYKLLSEYGLEPNVWESSRLVLLFLRCLDWHNQELYKEPLKQFADGTIGPVKSPDKELFSLADDVVRAAFDLKNHRDTATFQRAIARATGITMVDAKKFVADQRGHNKAVFRLLQKEQRVTGKSLKMAAKSVAPRLKGRNVCSWTHLYNAARAFVKDNPMRAVVMVVQRQKYEETLGK